MSQPNLKSPATGQSDWQTVDAEASEFIKFELDQSRDLSRHRRNILEAALGFANRVSHRSNDSIAVDETGCALSPSSLPPFAPETLFLLTRGEFSCNTFLAHALTILSEVLSTSASVNKHQFPDQILPRALKRMAVVLVDCTVSGQALAEYRVCVCFKTCIMFSMRPALDDRDILLKERIRSSRNRYRDLTLSWNLVALGYHKAENLANALETDEEDNIHGYKFWCFSMERPLSMHLGRPPSLPSLEVNRAWLSHPDFCVPLTVIADLLEDFACIQDMVLSWRDSNRGKDSIEDEPSITAIQYRMSSTLAKTNEQFF
ncbi:hypothetical protein QQZ08_004213 [Neonectria magnoliae]|uniref:Uncharacterized protein n=1 Tax=Neonectria magnoliae TaxID=2732573 RepID=A0ABR1I6J3_9HYPO